MPIIEAILCLFLCLCLVISKRFKIQKSGMIWLLYILNIAVSLLTHESSFGLWGRGAITIGIACFVFLINNQVEDYKCLFNVLIAFGIITGALVIMQYFYSELFVAKYYPMLNDTAKQAFDLYSREGYYFGLLYNPHEPAGLITYAIIGLLLWKLASKTKGILIYLVAILLAVPLLLTGKKGILVVAVISFAIMILFLYGSRKQWIKVLQFLSVLTVLLLAFVIIAVNNPEIAIFNRFNSFIEGIIAQESVDSGRFYLYDIALSEWKEHKLLGIGWRQFNALTVEKYGMYQYHEVNCDYLQWLCETGIVGFVLSIMPVLIMLYRTIWVCRKLIRRVNTMTESWILLFAGFIQFFTLIYAFIEIPFLDSVFFTIYIFSCIVINSAFVRRRTIEQRE